MEHLHPDDREAAQHQHDREINDDGEFYFNAFRMRNTLDAYRHYEIHGFKVFNNHDEPVKLVGNLIDVEDKYRLSEMEDKHRYHLNTMLDNAFVRTILLDKDSRIIGLDGKTKKILIEHLGYNPISKKSFFTDIISDYDLLKFSIIDRVLKKGQEYRNELYLDLFENSSTCYDTLCKPILDYSKEIDGYVFYFFDLSGKIRLQQEVKSFQNKLITAHHFTNNVLSQVADESKHPIYNLLTTTKGIFEEESNFKLEDNLSENQIQGGLQLMKSIDEIINNVEFEHLFFTSQKSIDLALMLQNMTANSVVKANQENIDFSFDNFDKLVLVNADPVFLRQSLSNVLNLLFTICVNQKLTIWSRINNNQAQIMVKSLAPQKAHSQIESILDAHHASRTRETDIFRPLGEGIPFAIKYLEGINGSVRISNNDDGSCEFTMSFPLV
ncbi:Signal transduction histidine kinase [Nonlabens sp. Hel1_33_55]|uniref:PAS domain-containing protein n=1 Tax=Nonlabens sp. Hel1_33_55 TaxID=1336802 RepID=UPI000875CF21|nr:PAS domain-containing protein [Nonlabens sp. Hel1_33_55]SCX95729.1 Signal transduction histidine kinase [Nonlabens sp. Hel1_33_55]